MDMHRTLSNSSMISKRRNNKPLVEKRRRERINRSLEELKKLILQDLHKDSEEYEKMEKADILEMAVNHLKGLRRTQHPGAAPAHQSHMVSKYRTGYNECATEVMRYINYNKQVADSPAVKSRLMGHISDCVQKVNTLPIIPQIAAVSTYSTPASHTTPAATSLSTLPGTITTPLSSGRFSSFRPVRKSPTEAFEAPNMDYTNSPAAGMASTSSCVSPVDLEMMVMMSPYSLQSSSSAFSPRSESSHDSRSTCTSRSHTPPRSKDNIAQARQPAYMAALDIEEIRARFGSDVWRPW